jgi:hypothetical protein
MAISLWTFLGLHTVGYWAIQQFAYQTQVSCVKELESLFPKNKQAYRELVAKVLYRTYALVHTGAVLAYGFPRDPSVLFKPMNSPSGWIVSQYAIEFVGISGMMLQGLWNPLERLGRDFYIHYSFILATMGLSYWHQYTTAGSLIITIHITTDFFLNYFEYGRMTGDIYVEWISTTLLWIMFMLTRIQMMGASVILPLMDEIVWMGYSAVPLAMWVMSLLLGILYAEQCFLFYKLSKNLFYKTRNFLLHPTVITFVPDCILKQIDVNAVWMKQQAIEETAYDFTEPVLKKDFCKSHCISTMFQDADASDADASDADASETDADADADAEDTNAEDTEDTEDSGSTISAAENPLAESPACPEGVVAESPPEIEPFVPFTVAECEETLETIQESIEHTLEEAMTQWRNVITKNIDLLSKKNE